MTGPRVRRGQPNSKPPPRPSQYQDMPRWLNDRGAIVPEQFPLRSCPNHSGPPTQQFEDASRKLRLTNLFLESELCNTEWCSSLFHVDAFPRVHMRYNRCKRTHTPKPDKNSRSGNTQRVPSVESGYFSASRRRESQRSMYAGILHDKAEGRSWDCQQHDSKHIREDS